MSPLQTPLARSSGRVGESETSVSDWLDAGGSGAPLDLSVVLDAGVVGLMAEVVAAGALVSFGLTSDGGALGCTVTVDGRWRREYFREAVELGGFLSGAAEWLNGPDGPSASSAPRGRPRRPRDPQRSR